MKAKSTPIPAPIPKSKKKLAAAIEDIRADFGKNSILVGSAVPDAFDDRLPSSIMGINLITRGGFPYNALTEIEGAPATFKTTICLDACKNMQDIRGSDCAIVWLSTEGIVDRNWGRHLGMKLPYTDTELGRMQAMGMDSDIIAARTADQSSRGAFITPLRERVEEQMDHAYEMLRTGEVDLYVFDSFGSIYGEKERSMNHGDYQVAEAPKIVSKHMRKLHSLFNKWAVENDKTVCIGINQVRAVIGSKFPMFQNPAGYQLKHGKVLQLGTKVVGTFKLKGNDEVWAKEIAIKVKKSKVCIPDRQCVVRFVVRPDNPMDLPIGPDKFQECVNLSIGCGVLDWIGNKWTYRGDGFVDVEGKNIKKEELSLFLQSNPDVYDSMVKDLIKHYASMEIS